VIRPAHAAEIRLGGDAMHHATSGRLKLNENRIAGLMRKSVPRRTTRRVRRA